MKMEKCKITFIEKYFNENITLCRNYSEYMCKKLKLQFIASKSEGIRNKSQARIIYRYWNNWRFIEHAKRHQAWKHYVCMYMCVYIQTHIFTHIHAYNDIYMCTLYVCMYMYVCILSSKLKLSHAKQSDSWKKHILFIC